MHPGGNSDRYTIHFQVWRPSEAGIGCFSLVGNNFPSLLAPSDHCVSYTVLPRDQILVAPGDVIGFHSDYFRTKKNNLNDRNDGGLQIAQGTTTFFSSQSGKAAVVGEVYSAGGGGGGGGGGGEGGGQCGWKVLTLSSRGAPVISATVGEGWQGVGRCCWLLHVVHICTVTQCSVYTPCSVVYGNCVTYYTRMVKSYVGIEELGASKD